MWGEGATLRPIRSVDVILQLQLRFALPHKGKSLGLKKADQLSGSNEGNASTRTGVVS